MAKKIEEKYKKLTDQEHVLLRPSMYLGSINPNISSKYVISDGSMIRKEIVYIPAFIKLFDEIITNSIDESKRIGTKINTIKVLIRDNKISVWDNGGISVEKHKEHNEWVPEMVFSNMKSGSNFSDDESRTWSGTNGVGSSCVNIFSKEFTISTCDGKKQFFQTFKNNMTERSVPKIIKSTKNHTEISFIPDFERFGLDGINDDNYKIIEKRVYDIAGCNPNLKIYLNDSLINIKSFEDYVKLYTNDYFFENNKEKSWSISISPSNSGFQQISFVNSTETYDGGNHVDYILSQIISEVRDFFQKKHKVDVKPSEIKNHIFIFINSTIVNPSFSSQTKEKLITEVKDFGSTYQVTDKTIKSILKSEIVQSILDWIDQKKLAEENKLQRDLKKRTKVEKLIDCQSPIRTKCELFIMEGLSAIGDFRKYRDPNTQAAYSLKGKFVNTNGMSKKKILEKEEAKNLIQSIGLNLFDPSDISGFRYGKIIICSDMDTDGDSICGLLLNFFSMWDNLFKLNMIYRALTPLLVVSKKNGKGEKIYFYTYDEYNKWIEKNNIYNYEIDYKKGLGSLESAEFKDLIQNTKLIKFDPNDGYQNDINIWFGDESNLRKNKLVYVEDKNDKS